MLFLYTDGITEATNDDDEEFGAERLHQVLCRHCACDPPRLVEAVLGEVRAFTNGADPGDDLTMVVVARTRSPVVEQVGADVAS
jgi:sigma-B regulation protein RsbU (phosphoserine phosphatase)